MLLFFYIRYVKNCDLCIFGCMFSAVSFITADAVTELQVSNSKLAELETAFATQKSEVSLFT